MSTIAREPEHTARAFDAAAAAYDEEWESLPATRRIRRIVHTILNDAFPPHSSILELNAGTGTDAVYLAGRGVTVLATDISPRMLEVIRNKAGAAGVRVETALVDLEHLDALGARQFDGILSNMGGMNCIQDLRPVALHIARLVVPGGCVVLGFMPAFSFWETAAFAVRGRWRDALRRHTPGSVTARVAGRELPIRYHSPADVAAAFSRWFTVESSRGLNVVSPPPGSRRIAAHGALVRLLDRCDDVCGRVPLINRLGDHCVMVLRRTSVPAA